jgi:RimJ/RimL family protein N-acetyltransferase
MSISERLPSPIDADRVVLTPLREADAGEMVLVLASPDVYAYTGGEPPTLENLRGRYARMVVGHSPDGEQEWLNWVVRVKGGDRAAVGTVQATVVRQGSEAEVAWVIGAARQGRGYGSEAAAAMVRALVDAGVTHVIAHIHPDHAASEAVARRCGLTLTSEFQDGERRWEWRRHQDGAPPAGLEPAT